MRPGRADRDLGAGALIAVLALAPLLPCWAAGLVHYWGDLSYLHRPWHAYDAQLLQAGRVPLWNPYLYFGMPQAAAMQDGLFYPASALFALFSFPRAAEAFAAAHVLLAGWLTYLWLRAARLAASASLLGGCVVALGGVFLESRQFLNHLSTLALTPAVLLSFSRAGPLALALALGFLAGFPPFFVGSAILAWALALALAPARGAARKLARAASSWAAAGLTAAGITACLLGPAAELALVSRRSSGVALDEALLRHFAAADLLQWIGPLAAGWTRFDPSGRWWTCCYIGVAALLAAALGLARLTPRRRWALAAWIGVVLLLTLGPTTALSRAAWAVLPPLRWVRYPGNLTYLVLWPFALLAARGVPRGRAWLVAVAVVELSWYGWRALPMAPTRVYGERGPLVARLQGELGDDRYLLSPKALSAGSGANPLDWSERLYGLGNAPFRLRAAGNLGEPLAPRANYQVMDALLSAKDASAAAALFPWTGIRFLLTPEPAPAAGGLRPEGSALWAISRFEGTVAPAYFFARAAEPPGELAPLPLTGRPLAVDRPREDRFAVAGESEAPGWVYISEPLFPGWKIALAAGGSEREASAERAMTAFQKVIVPAGRWRLTFRYDPLSWRVGWLLTLLTLASWAAYWQGRLRRWRRAR